MKIEVASNAEVFIMTWSKMPDRDSLFPLFTYLFFECTILLISPTFKLYGPEEIGWIVIGLTLIPIPFLINNLAKKRLHQLVLDKSNNRIELDQEPIGLLDEIDCVEYGRRYDLDQEEDIEFLRFRMISQNQLLIIECAGGRKTIKKTGKQLAQFLFVNFEMAEPYQELIWGAYDVSESDIEYIAPLKKSVKSPTTVTVYRKP